MDMVTRVASSEWEVREELEVVVVRVVRRGRSWRRVGDNGRSRAMSIHTVQWDSKESCRVSGEEKGVRRMLKRKRKRDNKKGVVINERAVCGDT
jgi:ATP-dependent DNA ligase